MTERDGVALPPGRRNEDRFTRIIDFLPAAVGQPLALQRQGRTERRHGRAALGLRRTALRPLPWQLDNPRSDGGEVLRVESV